MHIERSANSCALANTWAQFKCDSNGTDRLALDLFTKPTKGVMVVLDGQLIVRRAHTDSIMIENIVAGMTEVRIAAGSGATRVERDLQVDVEVGRVTTISARSASW